MNDDHFDAGSGLNTDHADSYLMVKLPANGKYFVSHSATGGGRRERSTPIGSESARPQPDFALRVIPSRVCMPSKGAAAVTVFALRKDGFDGPIQLKFKGPAARARIGRRHACGQPGGLWAWRSRPVLRSWRSRSISRSRAPRRSGTREIVHDAVPAEDKIAGLPLAPSAPCRDSAGPGLRPFFSTTSRPHSPADPRRRPTEGRAAHGDKGASVEWYLRQLENLYQDWFLTDEFVNREVANVEGPRDQVRAWARGSPSRGVQTAESLLRSYIAPTGS